MVSGVVEALARHHGWTPPADLRVHRWTPALPAAELDLPRSLAGPDLLGRVLEASIADDVRQATGAHYTPAAVAAGLTGLAYDAARLADAPGERPTVLDPTCGGGAFVLAAADRLVAAGHEPAAVARESLWGIDVDPVAVAATQAAVALWAWLRGDRSGAHPGPNVTDGDAFGGAVGEWSSRPPSGFDLVVGNPPFLGQLGRATARSQAEAASLRSRLGDAVAMYTDAAALFLLVGVRAVRPGGAVTLIVPTSVLAARDAAPVRSAVLGAADLVGLWTVDGDLFDANVRVCAPLLRRVSADGRLDHEAVAVARWHGVGFTSRPAVRSDPRADRDASWSPLVADLHDVPEVDPLVEGTLGDLARATAGFRAQYYGLVGHVREGPPDADAGDLPPGLAPLVTVGLVDVGRCAWGQRDARFGRRRWCRPVVDLVGLRVADPTVARWVDQLQVPKVVVATQTRVGEAAVDERGTWVPSVPSIAVVAPADRLWAVAAVVCSPVASALAVQRTAGTALSARAVKLSAWQVLDLPCPADRRAWDAGADALRAGDLDRFADAMATAYGLGDSHPVTAWWHTRRAPGGRTRR